MNVAGTFSPQQQRILRKFFGKVDRPNPVVYQVFQVGQRYRNAYCFFVTSYEVTFVFIIYFKGIARNDCGDVLNDVFAGRNFYFIFRALINGEVYFTAEVNNLKRTSVTGFGNFRSIGFKTIQPVFFFAGKQCDHNKKVRKAPLNHFMA